MAPATLTDPMTREPTPDTATTLLGNHDHTRPHRHLGVKIQPAGGGILEGGVALKTLVVLGAVGRWTARNRLWSSGMNSGPQSSAPTGAEEHAGIASKFPLGLDHLEAIGGLAPAPAPAPALIGGDPKSALTIDGAVVGRCEPAIF